MENTSPKTIKGIKIRTLNLWMILASCVLYILLILATIHASGRYTDMVAATREYITCEENAALVTQGSDFLTEQVRLYTVTFDPKYVAAYFTEANVTRRRDNALALLREYQVEEKPLEFLQQALDNSNSLMEQEIYAMRLIAASQNAELSDLPEEIRSVSLTAQDLALTPEEMILKAQEMVFGSGYQNAKELITSNITYFINSVSDGTQYKQQQSVLELSQTMKGQQILISVLFIENIFTFILIIRLIIKPLQIYVSNIRDEKMLEITGSYEFKYLALTYNSIYELNSANEAMLRHRAEHDPLTGIINRGTFEQLRQVLKTKSAPIALLIIDVDKFKLVNDGYGHEMGDRVLKRVAKLLETGFRSTDYPARIGGDEFAVILTDAGPEMEALITEKIRTMNEALMHPADDLPAVSLSVGGAFSKSGFADDLYNKADTALYHVKENGRCNCSFYREEAGDTSVQTD